jgi:arabinose-5-phosphate isomerase
MSLEQARSVLKIEAEAVASLIERLDDRFVRACDLILASRGRVVVTGIGKSGAIARKIAATLASTGTPALFLHPAEGVHGDLGMVTHGDVVIALSYSGESDEIVAILPVLKRLGVPLIAFTGRPASTLGEQAEVILDVSVPREACPLNLAPTASTTAALAMGDALALTVMARRRFTPEEFALFHPAGALGRRLLLRVGDLMRTGEMIASVTAGALVREALFAMTRARAGAVNVLGDGERLLGLLTDGDIRRLLLRDEAALTRTVESVFNATPRTTRAGRLVTEALAQMEGPPPITEMPVLDDERRVIGVLNLGDIVKAGIV